MKGERIDRFLSGNLEDLSRSYIQKLLKDEKILVNGGRKDPCKRESSEVKLQSFRGR